MVIIREQDGKLKGSREQGVIGEPLLGAIREQGKCLLRANGEGNNFN